MPEHVDSSLSPGTTYFYRVIARNSAGESSASEGHMRGFLQAGYVKEVEAKESKRRSKK